MVLRRLLRLVEERTGDVTDAGTEPNHAGHDHLLGLPARVGGNERQGDNKRGLVGAGEVAAACQCLGLPVNQHLDCHLQADQPPHICVRWCEQETKRACDSRQHEESTHKRPAILRHVVVYKRSQADPDDHQRTLRDAEQRGLESIEPKPLDDKRAEVGDAAVRDVGHEAEEREQPRLVVEIGLLDLTPIHPALLDAGLVAPYPGDHDELLFMGEAAERRRRVGEQYEEYNAPESTESADDDELVSPGVQGPVDVADPVA